MGVYMTSQEITLRLPAKVYDQVRKAAERAQRPIGDLIAEALIAAAPMISTPTHVSGSLAQLAYLNDAALLQVARATVQPSQRNRLTFLHDKQQREGLSLQEQDEEQLLLALYRETVLVRAQAAVLLKHRGYDVQDPSQFEPIA